MKNLLMGLRHDLDLGAPRGVNPQPPWTNFEMALGVAEATKVVRRLDGIRPFDRSIRARFMLHA